MAELTYRDAVARGIAQEMERDDRVVFLGEDVGKPGGVNHLHFQVDGSNGRSIPLNFGVWKYPSPRPKGWNGEWSGERSSGGMPISSNYYSQVVNPALAYRITALHSGKALDVNNWSQDNG